MFGTLSFKNTDANSSTRACDNCRLRKVKVSISFATLSISLTQCPNVALDVTPVNGKFQPCDKCMDQALPCTYERLSKKKGPKISPKTLDLVLNQPWELTEQIATEHFEEGQQFCVTPEEPINELDETRQELLEIELQNELTNYFQHMYTTYPIIDLADDNTALLEGLRLANLIHSFKNGTNNVTKTALVDQIQQIYLNRLSNSEDTVSLHSVCDSIFLHMAMAALGNRNKAMVYLSEAHSYFFLVPQQQDRSREKRINCILTSLRFDTGAHHLSTDLPNYTFDELASPPYYGPLSHLCDSSYNQQVISLLLWHTSMSMQKGYIYVTS